MRRTGGARHIPRALPRRPFLPFCPPVSPSGGALPRAAHRPLSAAPLPWQRAILLAAPHWRSCPCREGRGSAQACSDYPTFRAQRQVVAIKKRSPRSRFAQGGVLNGRPPAAAHGACKWLRPQPFENTAGVSGFRLKRAAAKPAAATAAQCSPRIARFHWRSACCIARMFSLGIPMEAPPPPDRISPFLEP